MNNANVSAELPAEVAELVCQFARRRGQTLTEFIQDAILEHLEPEEAESWRRAFGGAAIADYEAEFGKFTPEEVAAARRFWQG